MDTVEPEYSQLIKEKRHILGLTQKEFSEILGLKGSGERTVSGWERGEHKPSPARWEKIKHISTDIPFKADKKKKWFKFIDLFAGIGGIRLPFQEKGGECVFSSEWDKFSKKTYAANYGELPHGDITKISSEDVPGHDILLAGFPCQAFSQAGLRKGFMDTRGTLFFEIQRILVHRRPKIFLLENVKQLRGHDKGKTLASILSILRGENTVDIPLNVPLSDEVRDSLANSLNYEVDYRVLKAINFGVPQNRERVYIVGFDRDYFADIDLKSVLSDIFSKLESKTTDTRLGDILDENSTVEIKYTISDRLLAGHERRRKEHKRKGNGFGYSVFNKESPYCNTISARYYKDGSEILIDQSDIGKNPRKLTPRECARIQGFPEKFTVGAVSDAQIYKQFGNSVSVPVIREVAKLILKVLKKHKE
tara:strand:+ start:354 stop:1616 length:1263 start_codon:yes stop_codon:yes gene_type:complete